MERRETKIISGKVSVAQTNVLCTFFEDNPEVIRGYKRTAKCMDEVQNKWKKITEQLNSLGPPRDHKSWAKYICDMKAKLKRKKIKWRQNKNGTGPIMCNADDFDEIKLRMLQVLRKYVQESQESHTSDLEMEEDIKYNDHIEDKNNLIDIFPEEKPVVQLELDNPEYMKLVHNNTPPPDLQPQFFVDDEFDVFGRNVAQQLRTLPLHIALETQEMLLSVIKKQHMRVLNETSTSYNSDPLSKT